MKSTDIYRNQSLYAVTLDCLAKKKHLPGDMRQLKMDYYACVGIKSCSLTGQIERDNDGVIRKAYIFFEG